MMRSRLVRLSRNGSPRSSPPDWQQLAIALLHWKRGEKDVAEQLIRRYLGSELAPGHRD
jgi:hypothetical protein